MTILWEFGINHPKQVSVYWAGSWVSFSRLHACYPEPDLRGFSKCDREGLRPIVFSPGTLGRTWGTRPIPSDLAMLLTPAGLNARSISGTEARWGVDSPDLANCGFSRNLQGRALI